MQSNGPLPQVKEIQEHKSITKGLDLCEGFPEVFGKFFDYIRGLKHGLYESIYWQKILVCHIFISLCMFWKF
jgi:hypothetical protein